MLFKGVILKCCSQINGDRTIQSIYHLLTGRRSIQTVQDAHLYKIGNLYGVYKNLSFEDFEKVVSQLSTEDFITQINHESVYTITPKGIKWLNAQKNNLALSSFKGLQFYNIDLIFSERLLLLIQVLTNSYMNNSSYIPIIDKVHITTWVKQTFKRMSTEIESYVRLLYKELHELLSYLSDQEADLFVNRLTGYKRYGMSTQQLAHTYQMSQHDIQLLFIRIIHQMLHSISHHEDHFKLMKYIVKDLLKNSFLTESASKTYELIKAGHSIDQVANIRNLKKNTIYDHIVEITFYDKRFSIQTYVSDQEQLEILNAIKKTNSSKLKTIKAHINENISYFQIRLTLAVMTREYPGDIFDRKK